MPSTPPAPPGKETRRPHPLPHPEQAGMHRKRHPENRTTLFPIRQIHCTRQPATEPAPMHDFTGQRKKSGTEIDQPDEAGPTPQEPAKSSPL